MAGGSRWPPPSERSRAEQIGDEAAAEAAHGEPEAAHGERYGVLEITREVKEDGRALILYARAGRETK
jgi:hypothetical protein